MRLLLYIGAGWAVAAILIYLLLGPGQGLPSYAGFLS
jgi:hypothetical protein